jgi:hypothetical protein
MVEKISMLTRNVAVFSIFFLISIISDVWICHAGAPVPGKTYNQSNWQEIEECLSQNMKGWLQRGEFAVTITALDYDFGEYDAPFSEKGLANKEKYDVDPAGLLVEKATGEMVTYLDGAPFPEIDSKDPLVAQKIMENMQAFREHELIYVSVGKLDMLSERSGTEKYLLTTGNYFYFWNRLKGKIPNLNSQRKLDLTLILEPYDLRGTVIMGWEYIEPKQENATFSYVPMIRRVVRTSAAARSDPFMGSDGCTDDAAGWGGKNASMTWKYIGEHDIIVPVASDKKIIIKKNSDGSFQKWNPDIKMNFEVPGSKYASYFPAKGIWWVVRPCWIVEAFPKDAYYNYGRQIMYLDREAYKIFYKVIYDRAGEYWKSVTVAYDPQTAEDGSFTSYSSELYLQIDDKTRHGTVPRIVSVPGRQLVFNTPIEKVGPDFYTAANMMQLGK